MSGPTVGLALIVRDEEKTLPALLESIAGAFDQVALVDTGSEDNTEAVFETWAREEAKRQEGFKFRRARFEWRDDFAAARAYADNLLETDWVSWADADDVIQNAGALRKMAADAPPQMNSYICGYNYARDQHGNCACYLVRERLVRRGAGKWVGRVHEYQEIEGAQMMVDPGVVEWVHNHPPDPADSNERNIRILEGWVEDEPEDPRVVGYLGTELLIKNEIERASEYFERYLRLKTGWDEERAQIHRKLAMVRMRQGRYEDAIATAMEAMGVLPQWTDSYLSLAEAYHELKDWPKAIHWAREVLRIGQPQTMLIVNPLDYKLTPKLILSSALGQLGQLEEAISVADEVLAIVPDHIGVAQQRQQWMSIGQREATAETVCMLARQLIKHDEQLKALALLEDAVPYFAQDHAEVVAMRSQLRERLAPLLDRDEYGRTYAAGGLKQEEFTDDEKVNEIGASLPRCAFLRDGILEQLGAAA